MGKVLVNDVLDASLDKIATGTILTVCSDEPSDRSEAVTTYALADGTLTPGDGNGDFTIADGDTSGRKVTVAAQEDLEIDESGTATHVAICDNTSLLLVTTCSSQALTQGGTVTVGTFKCEIRDPS